MLGSYSLICVWVEAAHDCQANQKRLYRPHCYVTLRCIVYQDLGGQPAEQVNVLTAGRLGKDLSLPIAAS